MIYLKTDEEIEILRENNLLVSETLAEVGRHVKPGISTLELDESPRILSGVTVRNRVF